VAKAVAVGAIGGGPGSARVFAVGFGCFEPWRIVRTPGAGSSGTRACCRPTTRCWWCLTRSPVLQDLRR